MKVLDEGLAVLDDLLRVVGLLQGGPEGPEDRSSGQLPLKVVRDIEARGRSIRVEVLEAVDADDLVPCLRARRKEGLCCVSCWKGSSRPSRAARGRLPPRDLCRIGRMRARRRRGHVRDALALTVEVLALAFALLELEALACLAELAVALGGEEPLHPEELEGQRRANEWQPEGQRGTERREGLETLEGIGSSEPHIRIAEGL